MQQPTLVIMAAGMGSRFGGLKQATPVDEQGHFIIDFSLYDAWRAGFRRAVFIIKEEMQQDFREKIGRRMEGHLQVEYVYQNLENLPSGYTVPEGRTKPWGTAHAVDCAADVIDGPFAVINSDDFYGQGAFKTIYDFLKEDRPSSQHAMVGYMLRNTVTEHGYVSRGICQEENGFLTKVTERTHIEKRGEDGAFTEDGKTYTPISGDTIVSMNLWGFGKGMLQEIKKRFPEFLDKNLPVNPLKCEYFLPSVVNGIIEEHTGTIRLLSTDEAWYGVTYKEDLQSVWDAVAAKKKAGIYPESLWG
jgi:NDP-sugar pyrophosphorylase family protein